MANASWRVTKDQPDQVWFVNSADVTGHLISFVTGNGHAGSVQVPDTEYTVPRVKAIVQAKANIVDEVGSLSSGDVPATI